MAILGVYLKNIVLALDEGKDVELTWGPVVLAWAVFGDDCSVENSEGELDSITAVDFGTITVDGKELNEGEGVTELFTFLLAAVPLLWEGVPFVVPSGVL